MLNYFGVCHTYNFYLKFVVILCSSKQILLYKMLFSVQCSLSCGFCHRWHKPYVTSDIQAVFQLSEHQRLFQAFEHELQLKQFSLPLKCSNSKHEKNTTSQHVFHWLFTSFGGLFEHCYPRLLYKPRERISSLDLSELPGGLFGRKEWHEEQRNEYENRLQRHSKNSKRG